MTPAEHRVKCIEAVATAMIHDMFAPHELPVCDELWRKYVHTATAAFDALHGIARVVPIEATHEMIYTIGPPFAWNSRIFGYMSAAGDLTDPPEGTP
jgi:hypothetical protein